MFGIWDSSGGDDSREATSDKTDILQHGGYSIKRKCNLLLSQGANEPDLTYS